MLRIVGTFIGCIGALVIITLTIRAPVVMLLVSCLWAGALYWYSSLVRVQNSYAFGLAGYTALIIIVGIQAAPLTAPQYAIERCSEIVLGIVCAILADILFSPRSINGISIGRWMDCCWININCYCSVSTTRRKKRSINPGVIC